MFTIDLPCKMHLGNCQEEQSANNKICFRIRILPGIKWNNNTKILPTFSSTLSVPRPHFPLSNASATGHPPNLSSNTFVTLRAKLTPAGDYLNDTTKKKPALVFRYKRQQHNVTR